MRKTLLRPTTLRTPPTGSRNPITGEHIAQGKGKQYEQKEEADGRKNPGEPTAVTDVHEDQNHQTGLDDRDGHVSGRCKYRWSALVRRLDGD